MSSREKRIYLSSPTMNGHEKRFVDEAFETNWIAPMGPNVAAFGKELCEHIGAKSDAVLASGTAAIHLALKLTGIRPGDKVFCSSLTFSASANPILYEQGEPVFIDSEEETWGMSPEALERAFEKYPNPRAVILVHLYGIPAKLNELMDICSSHGVPVIEDAAEALASTYHGKYCGTFGKYGCFSFNGNKLITTSGGGMIVSESESDMRKARFWATQSREWVRYYQHYEVGYNYRMSNVCAGIGRGQLFTLEEYAERKRRIRSVYSQALGDLADISFSPMPKNTIPNCWLTCIRLRKGLIPVELMDVLESDNIESRHIWKPMHEQPLFGRYEFFSHRSQGSVASDIFADGVCLPSDIKMTDGDMDRVCELIRRYVKGRR